MVLHLKTILREAAEVKETALSRLDVLFGKWGRFCCRRPWWVMAASTVACLLCGLGFLPHFAFWINGAEDLYSLPVSKAREDGAVHRSLFESSYQRTSTVVMTATNGRNLLTHADVEFARAVDRYVRGETSDPSSGKQVLVAGSVPDCDGAVHFACLCARTYGLDCDEQSVIATGLKTQDAYPVEFVLMDGLIYNVDEGKGYVPDYFLGGYSAEPCRRALPAALVGQLMVLDSDPDEDGLVEVDVECINDVRAFAFYYFLRDTKEQLDLNLRWEAALIAGVQSLNLSFPDYTIAVNAFRSRDDELRSSTSESDDIKFVVLTCVILYVYAMLANFSFDLVQCKVLTGFAGVTSCLLSMLAGLGSMSLMGVAFVPTALVCPFLCLGVGVDDMFVLINTYSMNFRTMNAEDRVQESLEESGMAITITTLTSILAFVVGSFSPYLSIRNFCLFSAGCMLFVYLLCLTFVLPVLCLEARREERAFRATGWRQPSVGRIDTSERINGLVAAAFDLSDRRAHHRLGRGANRWLVWLHAPGRPEDASPGNLKAIEEPAGVVGRWVRRFFLNGVGVNLMRPWAKLLVALAAASYLSVSVYGFLHIRQGLDLSDLSPASSYLKVHDTIVTEFFTKFDVPADVFIETGYVWSETETIDSLLSLTEDIRALPSTALFMNPLEVISEDPDYRGDLLSGDVERFAAGMERALAGKYDQFRRDLVFIGDRLAALRCTLLPKAMRSSEERALWMTSIRRTLEASSMRALAWNYMMIFYESDLAVLSSVFVNMGVAALAILLVTFVLMPSLAVGLLTIVVMVMIDIGLFGFMYFWDVKLNMISMINLVISVGFAVDYASHMVHAFVSHCHGSSRNRRAVESLALMGAPVFNGAVCTLLGVFMLGFAESYVFIVFFRMFTLVVVIGTVHGLVVLPVLLGCIGPMTSHGQAKAASLEATSDPSYVSP